MSVMTNRNSANPKCRADTEPIILRTEYSISPGKSDSIKRRTGSLAKTVKGHQLLLIARNVTGSLAPGNSNGPDEEQSCLM